MKMRLATRRNVCLNNDFLHASNDVNRFIFQLKKIEDIQHLSPYQVDYLVKAMLVDQKHKVKSGTNGQTKDFL